MDFNALRAQTMWSGTDEEAVTVNTRALIDKVLARYSGEWTVLRELIQNAADASATRITIRFETLPSSTIPVPQDPNPSSLLRHTIRHHTLKRLVVTNNGQPFNENDWTRLKRIAEGNPDETKIGAFGVGFYSTFADCEEPFVSSGNEAMAFFWKNNSLFTRRLRLPNSQTSNDTNFVLDYRDTTSSVPSLLPLAQFLASSLTFVGIEKIELFVDEWNIATLNKKTSPSYDISLPKDIEPKTSDGVMKITKLTKEMAQIDAEWMKIVGWQPAEGKTARLADRDAPSLRKFFSRFAGGNIVEDNISITKPMNSDADTISLSTKVSATIFLNVNTASIRTFTAPKFSEELERATKKPPPKTTKLAVLTAPFLNDAMLGEAAAYGDVFGSVLPTRAGKIFIGFPTHQTTGLSAHISAPSVIPTVERESIDLNARYVRTWNEEMLRAAGIVCRMTWSAEMKEMKEKILRGIGNGTRVRPDDIAPVLDEAVALFKNFTFRESTPSSKTGSIIEDAFWTCGKGAYIEVLSSCGVLPTHDVRIAPKDLSFMEGIPVIPERIASEAQDFVNKLVDFQLVTEITVTDIKKALEAHALSSEQVAEFLHWITNKSVRNELDGPTVQALLQGAVANDAMTESGSTKVLLLGQMEYFLNPSRTPIDLPVPDSVMPFKYTKNLSKRALESLGWEEFQIVPWVRWLIEQSGNRNILSEEHDITKSASFSAQILPILSKQWDSISQSSKSTLIELLSSHTVIPTKRGMRKPGDAYFPHVKIFDDLATIEGLSSVKDKVLVSLGVRKTVELGVVFDRLLTMDSKTPSDGTSKPRWSHVDLLHYLASVRDDIPSADIQKLKTTPICPKVDKNETNGESKKRYKVSELFEPRPDLRDLGLPILAWPGLFRSNSVEGRLLTVLGLRREPKVPELIDVMAKAGSTGDDRLRDTALGYFISNHHVHGYSSFDYLQVRVPFLPLENNPGKLSTPSQCFVDPGAAIFGFQVIKYELAPHAMKFGVRMHPPMDSCINILSQRPPTAHREARELFSYFAGRLNEINSVTTPRLADLNFIPIFSKGKEKQAFKFHTSPKNCFLGDSDTFGEIFDYVDFGHEGNTFLLKCGSKNEPTKLEIAQILVREPARISSTFKNAEKYLTLLRSMADSASVLKKNKDLWREMKRAPFLLASKELPSSGVVKEKSKAQVDDFDDLDEDDSQGIREWQLASAKDVIIVDDYLNYNIFKTSLLAAPQEETLEDFYLSLGTSSLSSLVEEAARHGPRASDQRPAQKLEKQILERSQLFLHEQPADIIKHDTKWLGKNLAVQLVSSITLRRSLKDRDVTHTEKRTAVITQGQPGYTLWISGERPDLYQVSQALVPLLLTRPKLHSALTLEMLLKTDLLELRNRGFNVSRILRQKAAEARIAENKRQQELEEEQRRIDEQQKAWKAAQEQEAREKKRTNQTPGGFPDSPESKHGSGPLTFPSDDSDIRRQSRGLFSNLTRQLGLRNNGGMQSMLGGPLGGQSSQQQRNTNGGSESDPPPPYSQEETSGQKKQTEQTVTAPHELRENLLNAIKKTRAHNSNEVFSPGETNTVTETKSYCDERPAHDLVSIAEIKHGIQMFLNPALTSNSSAFLSANSVGLMTFANLLKAVGEIFSLNPRTLNIFHATSDKTIAFNRNGSIFCNYFYFQKLHEQAALKAAQQHGPAYLESEAYVYWWVILCHELAHNLVADHSSDHSFYTEGFVMSYFGKAMKALEVSAGVGAARAEPRLVDV